MSYSAKALAARHTPDGPMLSIAIYKDGDGPQHKVHDFSIPIRGKSPSDLPRLISESLRDYVADMEILRAAHALAEAGELQGEKK